MNRASIVAVIVLAACGRPHVDPPAPEHDPPRADLVVSITAACDGVAGEVFDIPSGWTVRIEPSAGALPMPEQLDAYLAAVPALAMAMTDRDPLDRDLFYVDVHIHSLARLIATYRDVDPAVLHEAKLQACRETLTGR